MKQERMEYKQRVSYHRMDLKLNRVTYLWAGYQNKNFSLTDFTHFSPVLHFM